MKAVVCTHPRNLVVQEIERPEPGEGQILVQVKATGICGSDVHGYLGELDWISYPIIFGHEFSGVVAAVGPGVTNAQPGDEVVVDNLIPCGTCALCLAGKHHLCLNLRIIGFHTAGSYAEYCIAPIADFVYPKPANLSFAEAALTDPLSGALHATRRANLQVSEFVVIFGAGTLGLMAMQVAKAQATEVLISDVSDAKLELARSLGADHVVNARRQDVLRVVRDLTSGVGADAAFEAVGSAQTIKDAVAAIRKGGRAVFIGLSPTPYNEVNMNDVTMGEKTLLGTFGFRREYPDAMKLLSAGIVKAAPLISYRFPLVELTQAMETILSKRDEVYKVVIEC